jgi:hypothetical protein
MLIEKHSKYSSFPKVKPIICEIDFHQRITALMLSSNVINLVNETMFPEHALPNLSTISLGKNPLACTCGNMWFRNWIKQGEILFNSFPELYVCKSPPNKVNTLFVDYLPSDADCSDNEVFIVVVTSLAHAPETLFRLLNL